MKKGGNSVFLTTGIIVVAFSLVAGWSWQGVPAYQIEAGNHVAEKAYYENQTDLMVEVSGEVVRLLDRQSTNSGIQWFQMKTTLGQHLLVSHDYGIGDPIELSPLDAVVVRGRYEWTESGGTIRETRRDLSLERRHGWIEHEGIRYD